MEANVAELCNTQLEMAEQMSAYRASTNSNPPSVIIPSGNSTAGSSIESSTAYKALLSKYQALEAKVETDQKSNVTDIKKSQGRHESRHKQHNSDQWQLKYYCPTCGVNINITYFGATCRFPDEQHADWMNAHSTVANCAKT